MKNLTEKDDDFVVHTFNKIFKFDITLGGVNRMVKHMVKKEAYNAKRV